MAKDQQTTNDGPKTKRRPLRAAFKRIVSGCLDGLYVLGLPPFRAFDYIELDLLTFLQAAESTRLNGREVYEHVLAVLAADETITLGVVKPLYCSCFHGIALFLYVEIALSFRWNFCRQVTQTRIANCRVPLNQTQLDYT
jgi:hypothetical protein